MDLTHNKCVAAQKQTYNMREGEQLSEFIWPGICLVFPNVRDKLQLFGSPRVLHSTCFFSSSSFRSCTFSSSNQLSCAINKHISSHSDLARKSDA